MAESVKDLEGKLVGLRTKRTARELPEKERSVLEEEDVKKVTRNDQAIEWARCDGGEPWKVLEKREGIGGQGWGEYEEGLRGE
ncbi:hypothetical protein Acr_10g0001360 [Actinidia rufa]|uniref:Uncharacterized protein n=1 Tax=Actinidia rufa TaxID=165716 RepID=A0A7J0F7Z5_9ERIC|nr:hypothetical protein Acr_10g0001360 [Actinidia rufa]